MKKKLTPEHRIELLDILKTRFEENTVRHKGLKWADVQKKIEANPEKLWSLAEMERTGGEPDVVVFDKKSGEFIFFDCAPESPKGDAAARHVKTLCRDKFIFTQKYRAFFS